MTGAPLEKVLFKKSLTWTLGALTAPVLATRTVYGTSKVVALTLTAVPAALTTSKTGSGANVIGVGAGASPLGVAGNAAPEVLASVSRALAGGVATPPVKV